MIGKSFLVLVVVSQICAFRYNLESLNYGKSGIPSTNNEFSYSFPSFVAKENHERSHPILEQKSTNNAQSAYTPTHKSSSSTSVGTAKNFIAKGKYSVALQNYGPLPEKKIPVYTSHVKVPVQEKPTVRLSSKIPSPKTIAHSCTCYKTILKPHVHQTLITVPSIQKYIETTHKPVIENIHYEAFPIKNAESSISSSQNQNEETSNIQKFQFSDIEAPNTVVSQTPQFQTVKIPSEQSFENLYVQVKEIPKAQNEGEVFQTSKTQTFEIPHFKFEETQKPQTSEIPRVQFVEAQKPQTIEIPRVQFVEVQKRQETLMPSVQFPEDKKPQTIEFPQIQFVDAQKSNTIEIPRFHFVEAQKSQTFEAPRVQFIEDSKIQTFEVPRVQFIENQKAQASETQCFQLLETQKPKTIEIPQFQFVESQKTQNTESPRLQFIETQKPETISLPRTEFMESDKFHTVEVPRIQDDQIFKNEFAQKTEPFSSFYYPYSQN